MTTTLVIIMVLVAWIIAPRSAVLAQDPQATPEERPHILGSFLGLTQAIDIAMKKHPLIQAGDANVKAADARTEQVRSLYYPQVYANFDTVAGVGAINPRFVMPAGAMLRQNLSQYAGGVVANQRLYDFGYTRSLVQSSQFATQAEEQDLAARRALVLYTVQRAYITSLKRHRLVQIAEETVRERGIIRSQIATLYRQQLKSKLDLDLVQVELTNAESLLVKARNDLKASFADLNKAMGFSGPGDYVLEAISVEVRSSGTLESLISNSLGHPELQRAKEFERSAQARVSAMKRQYLPVVSAVASAGDYEIYDQSRPERTGAWWTAGAMVSMPLFTGFLIENQVREANAQLSAAEAGSQNVQQTLALQVTNAYLDTVTLAQQIKLTEEQVRTAQEALQLARQRYKLGLGSVVEVTQSEVSVTAAQTRLAEAQYDYKIAEVTLAYVTTQQMSPNHVNGPS
jgi:outer membrane protein